MPTNGEKRTLCIQISYAETTHDAASIIFIKQMGAIQHTVNT